MKTLTAEQMDELDSAWRNRGLTRDEQEVLLAEAERARSEAAWLRAALRHMDDCPRCKFRGVAHCAQRPLSALETVP